jgi:tetratricopeptide (TPR) repeat protein
MLSFAAKVAIAADESNKALEIVNKILSMNPRSVDGLELRGVWYFLSGDTEHATKVLGDACSRIQTSTQLQGALLRVQRTHAAYSEARLAIKEGRYMEAIEQFTIAIKTSSPLPRLSPLFAALRTGRSESHLLAHQFLQALKDCQEVVTVRREYAPAWIVRSEVLIALGKVQDARNELSLARRTWGSGNPIIEEGYKRADFELRVVRVDAEITAFQSELEEGNTERLPRLEKTKSPGQAERSQKLKHRSGSVRNLNAPKKSALSHHRSFSGIEPFTYSFEEMQRELPRARAAKAKDDVKPPRQRTPRADSSPGKRVDDDRTDRRDRASAAASKDRSRSVSAGRQPRNAVDGNASQQLRVEKSHQSDDDIGAGRRSDKARSSERYRRASSAVEEEGKSQNDNRGDESTAKRIDDNRQRKIEGGGHSLPEDRPRSSSNGQKLPHSLDGDTKPRKRSEKSPTHRTSLGRANENGATRHNDAPRSPLKGEHSPKRERRSSLGRSQENVSRGSDGRRSPLKDGQPIKQRRSSMGRPSGPPL